MTNLDGHFFSCRRVGRKTVSWYEYSTQNCFSYEDYQVNPLSTALLYRKHASQPNFKWFVPRNGSAILNGLIIEETYCRDVRRRRENAQQGGYMWKCSAAVTLLVTLLAIRGPPQLTALSLSARLPPLLSCRQFFFLQLLRSISPLKKLSVQYKYIYMYICTSKCIFIVYRLTLKTYFILQSRRYGDKTLEN